MIGSWAGAMGHTQWMPEVWLHMGVDYDHDGRINAVRQARRRVRRHRALSRRARQLSARRSLGLRGHVPPARKLADKRTWRTYAEWQALGVCRADGKAFARPERPREAVVPVAAARPS